LKRLDALVLRELWGPWAFGVAIFSVLIMAGTYLFKITDYIVSGIEMRVILELSLLLLPGIMAKTFAMAVLLASLLAFGRLSSDSEIIAMKSSGISVGRIMWPVAGFGTLVAAGTFAFNELLVPAAAIRATQIQTDIAAKLKGPVNRPIQQLLYDRGKLVANMAAVDFDVRLGILSGVTIVTFDSGGRPRSVLLADQLRYAGEHDWRLTKGGLLISTDGMGFVRILGEAWPTNVARPEVTPRDLLAKTLRDLDALSMAEMRTQIARARRDPKADPGQIANLEYGYYNKIALPLAAIVYALVGAPIAIRNHRTGVAAGFWLSVIIIFGYMMLANLMSIYAQGGVLPAYVASFSPIVVGLVVAAVAIHRKNV